MMELKYDRPCTPWSRAINDWLAWQDEHGPFGDYAAWESWMNTQQVFAHLGGTDILDAVENLGYDAKIALYNIMCQALEVET